MGFSAMHSLIGPAEGANANLDVFDNGIGYTRLGTSGVPTNRTLFTDTGHSAVKWSDILSFHHASSCLAKQ
jgi:hypothetical protein